MRARALVVSLLCACLGTATAARADDTHVPGDRAQTSGPSLGVGVGFESAGFGGHALYYVQLPSERWRLAAHAGVGWIGRAAGSGGVMALFGRRHRFVIDLLLSPVAGRGATGERTELFYGIGPVLGWEWMARYGLAVRSTLGLAYQFTDRDEAGLWVSLNVLSLDYKLW